MKNYKSILATLFSAVLLFVCSCSNNTSLKTKVKMSFPVQNFYSVLTARGVEQDSVTINLDVDFYVDNTLYASQSKLVDQNKTSESFIFNGIEFGSTVYAKAEVKSVTVRDGKTYENQMLYGESETITVETEFVELPLTLRWVENQEEKPIQIEVTTSKLKSEIQNYIPGIKTIYKVKGQMTNSEFSELQELIENKSDNDWGGEYVGLDLSEVTGLTRIDYTWGFISLTIPSSVTEFGNYAQFDCVKILDGNPNFKYVDGVLYSADKTSLYFYPSEKTETSFVIPSGVQKIQSAAFLWNNNIQSITIPESVVFIGMAALQTNSITQLTFKNKENWYNDENRLVSASDLENPASYREGQTRGICRDGLFKAETKTVTVAQLTEEINSYNGEKFITYKVTGSMSNNDYDQINQLIRNRGDQERWKGSRITLDLSGVTDLTTLSYVSWPIASVTVPKTFSGVEKSIAYTNIIVTADNPYYKYVDGSLYSADGTILYLYSSEKQDESFEIPSTVKRVWRFAFYNNTSIQNITIPESVVEIGWAAFDNDRSNIQTLTFKNKENWLIQNNNNNISKVNPADLEKVENFRKNSETQINGIFRPGLFKTEIKTVTISQLEGEINSYNGEDFITYKVTGSMSIDECDQINQFINDKANNQNWRGSKITLDLSGVTGLTRINYISWSIASLIAPDTVSEFGKGYNLYKVIISSDNPYFKYLEDSLYSADGTILYYYSSEKTDVSFEIPSTVKKIWFEAFRMNYNIKSITIPANVIYIGSSAFDNSNIQTLTFKNKEDWMADNNGSKVNPDDLEKIENYRWNNQTQTNGICRNGLFKPETKTVTVSQLTDEINSYAGGDYIIYKVTGSMSNDEYRTIANLINNKRRDWNWNNYVGLDLSAVTGLTKISSSWCLFSLTIPSSVSELSDSDGVDNIIIPSDNLNFKYVDGSLYSADETILYKYPDNKTNASFEIPSTVTKIWSEAFRMNSNIKSITIPASVVSIGWAAFDNSNIQTLTFKNKENWMASDDNNSVIQANPDDLENVQNYRWNSDTQTNGIFRNGLFRPVTKTVTVAQLTNEINSYSGGDLIIYKVTGSMSNNDFIQLDNLICQLNNSGKEIYKKLGLDLTEVSGLTKISISDRFFTLTIPSSVSAFGDGCYLSNVIIPDNNTNFTYKNGILYSKDETILYYYPKEKTDTSFVIPSNVTKIWSYAFWNNSSIQSITIPESVVYIGRRAFDNYDIETLTFKDKTNWMVRGNGNGNSISKTDPDDLERPYNYRWNDENQTDGILRNGLFKPETKTVTVAQLTNEINSYSGDDYIVFKVTGSMSNDDYDEINQLINETGNNNDWNNSCLGLDLSSVTGLTEISFVSWPIANVTIPDSVSQIGEDTSFTKIIMSSTNSNFTYIDGSLYSKDKTILYLYSSDKKNWLFEIPSGVKKVWRSAFWANSNIQSITIPETVVYIGCDAFSNQSIQALTFKNKSNWMARGRNYTNIIQLNPDDLDNVQNFRWDNNNDTNGLCELTIFKTEIQTFTTSEMIDAINAYNNDAFVIFKVTGSMSNNEYIQIVSLICQRGNAENWNASKIGLDLSEVTGLTKIDDIPWPIFILYIPDTVTEFGESEVRNVILNSTNKYFTYVDGNLYSKDKTILYSYSSERVDETFEIPSTVKKVWNHAFYRNQSIRNIIVPESVIYVGALAFERYGLESITFKNKQNWFTRNSNNQNTNKVNPSDLDNIQNFIGGKFRYGILKPEIVTVAAESLQSTINSYVAGSYVIYKVTGSMTNNECNTIISSLSNNYWGYIGLDLSEVTGLTSVSWAGNLLYIELPDSVQ